MRIAGLNTGRRSARRTPSRSRPPSPSHAVGLSAIRELTSPLMSRNSVALFAVLGRSRRGEIPESVHMPPDCGPRSGANLPGLSRRSAPRLHRHARFIRLGADGGQAAIGPGARRPLSVKPRLGLTRPNAGGPETLGIIERYNHDAQERWQSSDTPTPRKREGAGSVTESPFRRADRILRALLFFERPTVGSSFSPA